MKRRLLLFVSFVVLISLLACDQNTDVIVSFETYGGTYVSPTIFDGQSALPMPDTPEKPAYAFGGWYLDDTHTMPLDPESFISNPVKDNFTVYARWEKILISPGWYMTESYLYLPEVMSYESSTMTGQRGVTTVYILDETEGKIEKFVENVGINYDGTKTVSGGYYIWEIPNAFIAPNDRMRMTMNTELKYPNSNYMMQVFYTNAMSGEIEIRNHIYGLNYGDKTPSHSEYATTESTTLVSRLLGEGTEGERISFAINMINFSMSDFYWIYVYEWHPGNLD